MRIYTADKIRAADQFTLEQQGIPSHTLMERAAGLCTRKILEDFPAAERFAIVCGTGNNGGDGVCIARQLSETAKKVTVVICGDPSTGSDDFKLNYQRLKGLPIKMIFWENKDSLQFNDYDYIIDAMFGTGVNRAIEGKPALIINEINASNTPVISIDMPSGLQSYATTTGVCIESSKVYSFEWPKPAFFTPENGSFIPNWEIISIGLETEFPEAEDYFGILTDIGLVKNILRPRQKFDHKGKFGHALIVAGSKYMPGAATLCSEAAITSGAGLVTLATSNPKPAIPEIMFSKPKKILENLKQGKYHSIAIGPGLGTSKKSKEQLAAYLSNAKIPMVIDADALNIIAANPKLIKQLPKGSILTPHPGEFKRLTGCSENTVEQWEAQKSFAIETGCTVILKRANTSTATPDGVLLFNSTGNAGMATAGSGDVLSGILAALLAQGYGGAEAAVLGVYLHGLAGDNAMRALGGQNLVASNIIAYIQSAYKSIIH